MRRLDGVLPEPTGDAARRSARTCARPARPPGRDSVMWAHTVIQARDGAGLRNAQTTVRQAQAPDRGHTISSQIAVDGNAGSGGEVRW